MKRIGLFYGAFDPITNIDIKQALLALKKHNFDHIEFVIEPNDHYRHQYHLVKLAINHYRRLKIFKRYDKNFEYVKLDFESLGITNGTFNELNKAVVRYCHDNCLYIEEILSEVLTKKRYEHVLSTATLCKELASHYRIDANKAYLAGLLHDLTKELTKDEQERLMRIYFKDKLDTNAKTWHQYTAMIKAKQDFMITDNDIIKAIGNHVNGTHDGLLSKIVYCSDKIEDNRGFDNATLKKKCFKNIDKAFNMIKTEQYKYINGGN
ncbi:MAG: bis(5'-nucleosyl)-tetraphosphatase (symmetrical) YqeK [Erysipelotrichaceae bacterium]|nr:bis(5'-nucleosyl)-tetraphosphatase (symmetrical) YqeK [Erysipelotrichaceae bacterium]MDD3924558.1 bis(5'-nucleosyl)-tetraphosphatase (symmetrical) YqeK [Erysipelotrichaceae bacterium]MDD4642168.1 bis(5'-nucleosyl)-tetraphosphatase (symmetrical) YqeK [Erysipelotrichaceae bacterium]